MVGEIKRDARELTRDEWLDVRTDLDRYFDLYTDLSPRERRSLARELYDAIQIRPGAFGVGVDIKALIEMMVLRRRERRDK